MIGETGGTMGGAYLILGDQFPPPPMRGCTVVGMMMMMRMAAGGSGDSMSMIGMVMVVVVMIMVIMAMVMVVSGIGGQHAHGSHCHHQEGEVITFRHHCRPSSLRRVSIQFSLWNGGEYRCSIEAAALY